ncbi:hypothetical protein AM1_3788 [Acaryochloris marina MBIC11017]|uniref:Uncharacterized protein n=1 Tax=Acaryochloris marina (strain MBIC 11017) TaxID=329726 RepID=B0C5Q4_ACAM1|nr:hypothetical protein AM1_3788 [Acaryochloris marina MBIC11017]
MPELLQKWLAISPEVRYTRLKKTTDIGHVVFFLGVVSQFSQLFLVGS